MLAVKSFYRTCENVIKKESSFVGAWGKEDPLCENSIRETKLFKNMLLDERGRLVFVVAGTGSEMFDSGRRGSFENVYTIVYLVSCLCGVILISSEPQGHEPPE